MTYLRGAWARGPYGAGSGTEAPPQPGQFGNPPPIPGGTATWQYESRPVLAWALRSWAGYSAASTYPGGGVSIRPDPDRGVMQVTAWWPNAAVLIILRQHPDGSLHQVRGGSPITVTQATRTNVCGNPSFENGLNGYLADAGNPVLSTITTAPIPRGVNAMRATVPAAGSCGITIPAATLTGGQDITLGVDLQFATRPTSVTAQIGWTDSNGVALTASTATLTTDQINRSVSQWWRQTFRLATPPTAVTATVKLIAGGLPVAGTMDVDGITIERALTDGSYFDGGTPGATWLGVAGLSVAVLAPVYTVDDGECPLDMSVRYRVINPNATGGGMTSLPATLVSAGRTWLTHPAHPGTPLVVQVGAVPTLTREAIRGVFYPLGGTYPVVVSSSARRSSTGDITIGALTFAERDSLLALFADLLPVYLRTPAEFGYGIGMWLALGTLAEEAEGRRAYQQTRLLKAPFHEVAAPSELSV